MNLRIASCVKRVIRLESATINIYNCDKIPKNDGLNGKRRHPRSIRFQSSRQIFLCWRAFDEFIRYERNNWKFGNFCVIYAQDLNVYRMEVYYVIDKKYYMMDYVCDELQTKTCKVKHFVRRYKNILYWRLILFFLEQPSLIGSFISIANSFA